jgi:alpha-L-rhamnosidase
MTSRLAPAVAAIALALIAAAARADLRPEGLRCESLADPLGIGEAHPQLSWTLASSQRGARQSAYQVVVASTAAGLDAPDLWDSGKVASADQAQVAYAGKALASRQGCVWRVRTWDGSDQPGAWSEPATWEMGLLAPADWHAKWIFPAPARPTAKLEIVSASYESTDGKVKKDVAAAVRAAIHDGFLDVSVANDVLGGDAAKDKHKRLRLTYTLDGGPAIAEDYKEHAAILLPPRPLSYLRRAFHVDRPVVRARLYATALGLYDLQLNGRPAGDHVLAPDWTDYRKRVRYQMYDVTSLVRTGDNAIAGTVANGWYAGHIGNGGYQYWGKQPCVMAQLELTHNDGSVETVGTDDAWTAHVGPIQATDFMEGESYDARMVLDAGSADYHPGPDWTPVQVRTDGLPPEIDPQVDQPVRELMTLTPKSVKEAQPGHWLFDLGQNMVGVARLHVTAPAGTRVTIRVAEMLNADGTIYTANYRKAPSIDTYVCKGGGAETWQPRFTFHGFRYVELTGLPGTPSADAVTGVVLGSDTPSTGAFTCSNADVNQLWSNIRWGQRGNFLSVPTDCPQRDERLGWMGDAQVFIGTAIYNADVHAFFDKWLVDVDDDQTPEGHFTNTSPEVNRDNGAPAWADAGVICPWTVYATYGDKRELARNLPAMMKWVDWCKDHSVGLIREKDRGSDFGDWLAIGANTSKELLGTAYFARSADLVARSAKALGDDANADKYAKLFADIKAAFIKKYVKPDGTIEGDTQTAYDMALTFDLMPAELRDAAAKHLVDAVVAKKDHLSTGFLGVSYLLPALSNAGHADVAYRLLLQDTFPSWLFSIRHGATTIWERWDGWTPDKGFQDAGMNSFNHYSLGSCGQWMYEQVAGIAHAPGDVGFAHVLVRPRVGGGLTHVAAHYDSIRGRIATEWTLDGGQLSLDVTVPPNVVATVCVPSSAPAEVRESGKAIATNDGVTGVQNADGVATVEVGSGTYHFTAPAPTEH